MMNEWLDGLSVLITESGWLAPLLAASEKYGRASAVLKIVMGALILLIGFYMFYLGF